MIGFHTKVNTYSFFKLFHCQLDKCLPATQFYCLYYNTTFSSFSFSFAYSSWYEFSPILGSCYYSILPAGSLISCRSNLSASFSNIFVIRWPAGSALCIPDSKSYRSKDLDVFREQTPRRIRIASGLIHLKRFFFAVYWEHPLTASNLQPLCAAGKLCA